MGVLSCAGCSCCAAFAAAGWRCCHGDAWPGVGRTCAVPLPVDGATGNGLFSAAINACSMMAASLASTITTPTSDACRARAGGGVGRYCGGGAGCPSSAGAGCCCCKRARFASASCRLRSMRAFCSSVSAPGRGAGPVCIIATAQLRPRLSAKELGRGRGARRRCSRLPWRLLRHLLVWNHGTLPRPSVETLHDARTGLAKLLSYRPGVGCSSERSL